MAGHIDIVDYLVEKGADIHHATRVCLLLHSFVTNITVKNDFLLFLLFLLLNVFAG